jgi:hypothetical protein
MADKLTQANIDHVPRLEVDARTLDRVGHLLNGKLTTLTLATDFLTTQMFDAPDDAKQALRDCRQATADLTRIVRELTTHQLDKLEF